MLYVIPVAAGTIPQEHFHPFTASVLDELLHTFTTNILIPPVVNQNIFIPHSSRQIDIPHLVIVIDAAILPKNPTPSAASRFVVMLCCVARFNHIPRNGCFHNRFQRFTHRNGTPGCVAGQGKSRLYRTIAIILFRHRKFNVVHSVIRIAKAGSTVTAVHTGLTDQYPAIFAYFEQTGEGIAMTVVRTFIHRRIHFISFFITGLRAFPAYHGIALRAKERSGLFRKSKTCILIHHTHTARIALAEQSIAECHIIVTHPESNLHLLSFGIIEKTVQFVSPVVHLRGLDTVQ